MICIDIGNSALRAARWHGGKWQERLRLEREDAPSPKAFTGWLDSLSPVGSGRQEEPCIIASVVPELNGTVMEELTCGGWQKIHCLAFPQDDFIQHKLETPETTGIDRLCAALAAYEDAREAVVVVDAGTAVTVDGVDAEGAFLGGAILPGGALWSEALSTGTAQLPPLASAKGDKRVPSLGGGTGAALMSGLHYGLAGAIERLVAEGRNMLGSGTPVYLTGGAAEGLGSYLDLEVRRAPDLVLDGVRLAAQTLGMDRADDG